MFGDFCRRVTAALFLLAALFAFADVAEAVPPQGVPIGPRGDRTARVVTEVLTVMAENKIAEELEALGETRRYELQLMRAPKDVWVPEGEQTFDVTVPNGIRYSYVTAVNVAIKINGVPFCQVTLSYRIHVFDKIVVAARNLRPGEALSAADVRLEEREVGSMTVRYVTDIDIVPGRELNRLVKEGTLITEQMLKYPVIIDVNATVILIGRYNGVEVKIDGTTLQRGRKGDVIRVKTRNGKIIRGRVIDERTIEIIG